MTMCPSQVEAARKITLEELPSVLILHLKCFVYDQKGGCQKLLKKIDFEVDLQIKKGIIYIPIQKRHISVSI